MRANETECAKFDGKFVRSLKRLNKVVLCQKINEKQICVGFSIEIYVPVDFFLYIHVTNFGLQFMVR